VNERRLGVRKPSAAILLECVIALAILLGTSIALLAMASRAVDATERARNTERAADLARSTLSRIELGLMPIERATGPVEAWRDEADGSFDDDVAEPTGWRLETNVEPSPFEGLSLVTVRAVYQPGGENASVLGIFSLTQAIRLQGREAAR